MMDFEIFENIMLIALLMALGVTVTVAVLIGIGYYLEVLSE